MNSRERFFQGMKGDARHCYLQVRHLQEVVRIEKVVDALLDELGVPGKLNYLRTLSDDEKFDAISLEIEHHSASKTSQWRGNHRGEILAGSIWCSQQLSDRFVRRDLFMEVAREKDLIEPVAHWLVRQGLEVHDEIPMGKKRADLLGYRESGWECSRHLVAVELKNDTKEFERAIDQMTTYCDYAHQVYLAATPALAADYLSSHYDSNGVCHWDAELLNRKLTRLGLGLLLIEGSEVFVHLHPRTNELSLGKVEEVFSAIRY